MKALVMLCSLLFLSSTVFAAGRAAPYQINGEEFEGYYVSPAAGAPLVLLIHDWDGLNAYEVKRAEMLSAMGYAVFAADLFGKGVRPDAMEERRRLTGALYQDRTRLRALLQGALAAASAQGGNIDNAVAIGYCFGGAVVLELARAGADLKGFVSFHGGLTTPGGQDYSQTKGSLLILHGSADTSVTMEHFAQLAVELEQAGVAHEMITYGGAPHAFTVFGEARYRKDADRKSWQRFNEYLAETLN
jgi:dienelactone hydrolase